MQPRVAVVVDTALISDYWVESDKIEVAGDEVTWIAVMGFCRWRGDEVKGGVRVLVMEKMMMESWAEFWVM